MNLRNVLLGTTAMLGAAALTVPSTADAFEVNINGFLNFTGIVGDTDEAIGGNRRSFDLETDTEIHIQGVNTDDETGIRYGMTVEFEADPQTSNNSNIDESWIFIDGGFGGIRLGNEDGVVANSRLGAMSIAAGTGGIDGETGIGGLAALEPANSSDSTKIRYYSPKIAGFTIAGSYTPAGGVEGGQFADEGTFNTEDWFEGGVIYEGSFGGLDLRASAVGAVAQGNNGAEDPFVYNVGAVVGFSGISVAGSWWENDDISDDETGYTLGAAATLGPADASVTWAQVVDSDSGNGEGSNLVVSASMGVLPGLSLHGDVAFFDRDIGANDDGVTGVGRLKVAF